MSMNWIEAIDARSQAALASGALVPVHAEQVEMEDAGMRFIVRWVSSLAAKDASKAGGAADGGKPKDDKTVAIPGGPRDPNFNPFLNPDPELTVGPLGDTHVAILNKFPLCDRHLVLARREFEEQLLPLARSDFAALDFHGRRLGFQTLLFLDLASFLAAGGAATEADRLRSLVGGEDALEVDASASLLEALLDPADVGGLFKVMVQVREEADL